MLTARWYFDADTIGVGHVLSRARRDVTRPGDDGARGKERWRQRPSPVAATDVPDDVWIPRVANAGMAIITRDRHIMARLSELAAVERSAARVFAIVTGENLDLWGLVEVVVSRWRDLERLAAEPGPYVYGITRTAVRQLFPARSPE